MPCNCGKKKTALGGRSYVYTAPNGQTQKFATEIEAKAAQVRNGGAGAVKAV